MARRANMPAIGAPKPAVFFDSLIQRRFYPGPAVANPPPGAGIATFSPPVFDGTGGLRIADIAKYKSSYAHAQWRRVNLMPRASAHADLADA